MEIPELELLAVKYMLNKCYFYTDYFCKPIPIYSEDSGLKDYQLKGISDIDNTRMFKVKSDIMCYNYIIIHVSGEVNCIADCLSGDLLGF